MSYAVALASFAGLWAVLVLLYGGLLLLAARHAAPGAVHVVGLWRPRVVVPPEVAAQLTAAELAAVVSHEHGHLQHGHLRRNFWRTVLLLRGRTAAEVIRQELEADAYAAWCGHGLTLAAALRKLSAHPVDLYRARRLEGWVGVRPATCDERDARELEVA